MPIYEFVCRDCGAEFEQLMSFSAHGHPACPACAGQHVNRKLGRPAIHFKGSGWYVTDSKGSKQSANGDAPARSGEKSESAGEKAGDKPAEKSGATAESSVPVAAQTSTAKVESNAPA